MTGEISIWPDQPFWRAEINNGRRVGAQSQLAGDEALLPPIRQDLAAARHELALLIGKARRPTGRRPDFDLTQLKAPAQIPVSLPSELVRRRPDILAAEAQLHAATADIGRGGPPAFIPRLV